MRFDLVELISEDVDDVDRSDHHAKAVTKRDRVNEDRNREGNLVLVYHMSIIRLTRA